MFPIGIMRERDTDRDDEVIALQDVPILQRLVFRFSEQLFRLAKGRSRAPRSLSRGLEVSYR
jgi:hypothetical protein